MGAIEEFLSDWPHLLLLGAATLGGALVGIGVLKESDRWSAAAIMVLAGIIIEPIATLGLFVYDEAISREQKTENSIAVTKAAEANERADLKRYTGSGSRGRPDIMVPILSSIVRLCGEERSVFAAEL